MTTTKLGERGKGQGARSNKKGELINEQREVKEPGARSKGMILGEEAEYEVERSQEYVVSTSGTFTTRHWGARL